MKPGSGHGLPAMAVRRPWLVVVLNLLILIAGIGAWLGVEVRELPNVDRPIVAVRADYPGAAPETLDAEVTRVIEGAAARVPGVFLVRSSSEEGNLRVVIEFNPGVDLVEAANDVRDAVARVQGTLPEQLENLTIVKADADAEPVMQVAVSSDRLSIDELTRVLQDRIEPELVSVPGVADITRFGARPRVMKVRVDAARLAAQGVTVDELAQVLRTARTDVPAGSLRSPQQDVLVRANASVATPQEVRALRLRPQLTLGEVADVFYAPAEATSYVRLDGRTVASLGIVRQAGANSVAISDGVRAVVERFNRDGSGLRVTVVSDDAVFIRGAIREVLLSLVGAVAIVVLVVGLFIGQVRATLVPMVAIPISLVGTLAAIWLLGFSLNLLTLLALLLATGLVVDDAIVVLENVQRRRGEGLGARAAAVLGTREVFFAVVATTATLVAVFVPISFLPSTTGQLFTEFGYVMAIAVMISSFVALSLGPMITARLPDAKPPGRLQRRANEAGGALVARYDRAVAWTLDHAWWVAAACVLAAVAAGFAFKQLPTELTPPEDRGVLNVRLDGPDGVNLAYSDRQLERALPVLEDLQRQGLVERIYTVTGRWDTQRVEIIAPLVDWGAREPSQQELGAQVRPQLERIPGALVRLRGGSSLGLPGADGSVQLAVTGEEYPRIAEAAQAFERAIQRELPDLRDVRVDWQATQPQLTARVDRERAASLGVPLEGLDILLRALVGGTEVVELTVGDQLVPVMLESASREATDPQDLLALKVRAGAAGSDDAQGALVPLSQFVRFEASAIPSELQRFGQRRAVGMSVVPAEGVSMQQAVQSLRALAERELPEGMGLLFRGEAATLDQSGGEMALTFGIALLVVFLVLVAQFEGMASAAVVLVTVPFALAAAAVAMLLSGTSLNLYSQIGLLLLIGVMSKNSILLVEFADQLRDAGRSVREAAQEAARTRLRPIAMTMASTVLGALPLVLSSGAGAEARRAIGWVIFGGLSMAAVFTLFLTPVVYLGIARFAKPRAGAGEQLARELEAAEHAPQDASARDGHPAGGRA